MSTLTIDRQDTFERSSEQRTEALKLANEVRMRRASLKRAVKAGQPVVPLVIDPPDWLAAMKLFDLLIAVPRWGQAKVNRILRSQAISPHKTVGGLSQRQREALVSVLAWQTAGNERRAR